MISVSGGIEVQNVNVMTSNEGGLDTEQITKLAMDKIMTVANSAPPPIKDQAEAFRDSLENTLKHYIELARREERATIAHRMAKAGQKEMADLVRRI
jgi:succinyl-CoA synthetase beta subunit